MSSTAKLKINGTISTFKNLLIICLSIFLIIFISNNEINAQTVSGTIREKCSGLPIAGYKLNFVRSPYNSTVTANASGVYSMNLTGLQSGTWTSSPAWNQNLSVPMSYGYSVPSSGPYVNQDYLVTNPTVPAFTINGLAPLTSGARNILVCGVGGSLPVVADASLFPSFCVGYRWIVYNSDVNGTNLDIAYITSYVSSLTTDLFSHLAEANGNYYKIEMRIRDKCNSTHLKSYWYHIRYSKGTTDFRLQDFDSNSDFPQATSLSSGYIPNMGNVSGWIGEASYSSSSMSKYKVKIYEVITSGANAGQQTGSTILEKVFTATSFPQALSFSQMFAPNTNYFVANYSTTVGRTYKVEVSIYNNTCGYGDVSFSYFTIKQGCPNCLVSGNGVNIVEANVPDKIHTVTENVFPNPVNDEVNIIIDAKDGIANNISVFNSSGRLMSNLSNGILQNNKLKFTLNTSDLLPGIYFFKSRVGTHISYGKFIKL